MNAAEIVATLARLRKERRISQAEIAALADFTRDTVSNWEQGRYPQALDLAAAWAQRCGHELVVVPRTANGAPSALADLVALLAQAHVTEPDEKEI